MVVTLEKDPSGFYILRAENGASRFFQSEWDFPYLAEAFGWFPLPATDFRQQIAEARDFIEDNVGATILDISYF